MTGAMLDELLKMCRANYPDYNTDYKSKTALWLSEFQKQPDDLMKTAMMSCIKFNKRFPTVADIYEAIRDLRYEEQTKPKALPWEVKREINIAQKAREFVQSGKTAEYMQSVNISKLHEYARIFFPDITAEMVIKNYPEFSQGLEQQDKCFACRTVKQACDGWNFKHWLSNDGWVSNQLAKCEKKNR